MTELAKLLQIANTLKQKLRHIESIYGRDSIVYLEAAKAEANARDICRCRLQNKGKTIC